MEFRSEFLSRIESPLTAGSLRYFGVLLPQTPEVGLREGSLTNAAARLVCMPEDYADYLAETGQVFCRAVATTCGTALNDQMMALADAFGLTPYLGSA